MGRPGIDPVVLIKLVLLQHLYGLNSLRRVSSAASENVCYRWFLGYSLNEEMPHFSTISYNFRHRFTEETVDQIFRWILEEVPAAGYLSPEAVFIDEQSEGSSSGGDGTISGRASGRDQC